MKISVFVLTVYIILFCTPNFAQVDKNLNSKKKSDNGLIFKNETEKRLADSSYTDAIQLLNLSGKAQALQFRILINKDDNDETVIIFEDILKGSDIEDPSWLLDYNVIKGTANSDGASKDEIFVLIYNSNQDGGLSPGSYADLFKVKYKVANIKQTNKAVKSSMKISNAEASTFNGFPIDITPSRDVLKINVNSK